MNIGMQEIMMLLGEKDLIIFQQGKQIAELQQEIDKLKILISESEK